MANRNKRIEAAARELLADAYNLISVVPHDEFMRRCDDLNAALELEPNPETPKPNHQHHLWYCMREAMYLANELQRSDLAVAAHGLEHAYRAVYGDAVPEGWRP